MFCPHAVDWEATRLWIQTCAAIVAGLGTIWTVWWTASRYAKDKKWGQARQVYAYIHREGSTLQLRVGNGSDLPVYDVFLYYFVALSIPTTATWQKVEKQRKAIESVMVNDVPIVQTLPPGDFRVVRDIMGGPGEAVDTTRPYAVEMVFRDSAGNLWTRRATGRLETESDDPMQIPRFKNIVGMAPSLPYVGIIPSDADRPATDHMSEPQHARDICRLRSIKRLVQNQRSIP
jgi:hypothetical protein